MNICFGKHLETQPHIKHSNMFLLTYPYYIANPLLPLVSRYSLHQALVVLARLIFLLPDWVNMNFELNLTELVLLLSSRSSKRTELVLILLHPAPHILCNHPTHIILNHPPHILCHHPPHIHCNYPD